MCRFRHNTCRSNGSGLSSSTTSPESSASMSGARRASIAVTVLSISRGNVPDAAILPQIVEQEGEGPQSAGGRVALQVQGDHGFGVPDVAGHQLQQDLLHVQDLPELRPIEVSGALEIPGGRHEAPHQCVDGLDAEPAPKRRQAGDLQEIDAGIEGGFGTEGAREVDDRPLQDARAFVSAQGRTERVAERLHRRSRGSEGLSHADRAAFALAGAKALPLGDRMREGEVGGQPLHATMQPLVVTGAEAHHGLAEHAPWRER